MKILAFSEHYYPIRGGNVSYVDNISRCLGRLGHRVTLVVPASNGDTFPRSRSIRNVTIKSISIPRALYNTRVGRRLFAFGARKVMRQLMHQTSFDIIHVLYGHQIPSSIFQEAERSRVATFWTVHNVPPTEYRSASPGRWSLGQRLYRRMAQVIHRRRISRAACDRLICVSDQTRRHVLQAGASPSRAVVIPIGVDTRKFRPLHKNAIAVFRRKQRWTDRAVLLTVGGFVPHKGQELVLKALPELIAKFPDILYVCIGPIRDRAYFARLEQLVARQHLEGRVLFLSGVSDEDLVCYYSACDTYIQPSLAEGFCLTALEAMACGKHIIGTGAGEMRNYILRANAGTIIGSTARAVCKGLMNNLEKPPRQEVKRLNRFVTREYSWEATAKKTVKLYQTAAYNKYPPKLA